MSEGKNLGGLMTIVASKQYFNSRPRGSLSRWSLSTRSEKLVTKPVILDCAHEEKARLIKQ